MSILGKWQRRQVEREKRLIKTELDGLPPDGAGGSRLVYIQKRIHELEADEHPIQQLRRYIFVMSALVQHERFGGLSLTQVRRAATLAQAILLTHGIRPGESKLAYLYGELHLVLSQIYRKSGRQWSAAWEQQMTLYSARQAMPGGEAFQSLSTGNRALRLGHARVAIEAFSFAAGGKLPAAAREKAALGHVKALRLAGRAEEARAQGEQLLGQDMSQAATFELEWELICCGVALGQDLGAMLAAVHSGANHHSPIYLLEASLWVKSIESRAFLGNLTKIKTLSRKPDVRPQKFGQFHKLCATLEHCYDTEIPLPLRIADLGHELALVHRLTTIDKELLCWAAASRFLARSSSFALATLALSEYVGLCLRLSSGRSQDVLGVVGDMIGREWFESGAQAHPVATARKRAG